MLRVRVYVEEDYAAPVTGGGTVTVFAADWHTGAAVPGVVKWAGAIKGNLGDAIRYTFPIGPSGCFDASGAAINGPLPISASVSAPSYADTAFRIDPPRLRVKVVNLATSGWTRTLTLSVTDAQTGGQLVGTVHVNGKSGSTASPITYPACASVVAPQPSTIRGPGGKPVVVQPKPTTLLKPCSVDVVVTGYSVAAIPD